MILSIENSNVNEYISLVRNRNAGHERNVHVITFGCQQNERDSETILGLCQEMGYMKTDDPDKADLIIINTCAIREHAEVKALSMLGRFKALKKKNPDLLVGVVGCMAAEPHRADMLKKDFHYVSFTAEPNMLHKIPELIARKMLDGKRSFVFGKDEGDEEQNRRLPRSNISKGVDDDDAHCHGDNRNYTAEEHLDTDELFPRDRS